MLLLSWFVLNSSAVDVKRASFLRAGYGFFSWCNCKVIISTYKSKSLHGPRYIPSYDACNGHTGALSIQCFEFYHSWRAANHFTSLRPQTLLTRLLKASLALLISEKVDLLNLLHSTQLSISNRNAPVDCFATMCLTFSALRWYLLSIRCRGIPK